MARLTKTTPHIISTRQTDPITDYLTDETGDPLSDLDDKDTIITLYTLLSDGTTDTMIPTLEDAASGEISYTLPEGALVTGWKVEYDNGDVYELLLTYYADEQSLRKKVQRFISDTDEGLIYDAMEDATAWVNSQTDPSKLTYPYPTILVKAATLYASASLIDAVYADRDDRSPIADSNQKKAETLLNNYLESTEELDEERPIITATSISYS